MAGRVEALGDALAGVGQNYVGQVSANNNNAGNSAANAQLAGGVANSNMYAGIGNSLGNLVGSFGSSYGAPAPYIPPSTGGPWYGAG